MPVDFTSPLLTFPAVPSSAPVETKSIGIMTDKISLPYGNQQPADNSPLVSSVNERGRDSGVAKAILKMSRNLVSVLETTTVILLLVVPRRLFCFGSLVVLDVVFRYLSLCLLYTNTKLAKN